MPLLVMAIAGSAWATLATFTADTVTNSDPAQVNNTTKSATITAIGTYLVPGSAGPDDDDVIQMVTIPKGAIVLQVIVTADGGTTNANFKVGIGSDTDLFIDDVQNDAAIKENMIADGNDDGTLYLFTADDTVDLLFDTAGPTAADTYQLTVTYVMAL